MIKNKLGLIAGLAGALCLALGTPPASSMSSQVRIEPAATKVVVKYDSRKHGKRVRKREGRYIHYHEGYYYATPWWTVAVPGVVVSTPRPACKTVIRTVKKWNARKRVTETVKTRTCV